jgi:phage shock protein PspC (stress-responsive transcriptional regulator)
VPPPTGSPAPQPGPDNPRDGFFDSIRRIGVTRSDDRWVGGVAGGVSERFGVDPLLVRGLLVLSFFLTGAGFVLYAVAWALLPERRDGRIHLQEAIQGRFDAALLGAVIAFVVGIGWNDGLWSWWGGALEWLGVIFWIAVWVAVIVLVVRLVRSRRQQPGGWTAPTATPSGSGYPVPPEGTSTSYTTPSSPAAPFTPAPAASYLSTPATSTPATSTPSPASGSGTVPPSGHTAPGMPATPVPPSTPPMPPRPRRLRRGPGAGTMGIVLGLILLTGAVLLVADRGNTVDFPFWPTWLGAAVAIVGLGIVVSGLRGRTGGGLTGLALVAALAALLLWVGPGQHDWDVWDGPRAERGVPISDGTFTPRSFEDAEQGAHVRFGSPTIDLTEIDLSGVAPGDPVEVPVGLTAGSVRILVPQDEAVEAQVRMLAGNVRWDVDDESRSVAGVTNEVNRFASPEVATEDGARLLVLVDARAGEIIIEESA